MNHAALLESLYRLETRLLFLVEGARLQTGREPGADPFRGLYISEQDVLRHLHHTADLMPAGEDAEPLAGGPEFESLARTCGLAPSEVDVLLIALAPEIDPRYEKIFAYLQDDVARRRPTVDLALTIISRSSTEKFALRTIFDTASPLRAHRLINISGEDPAPRRELSLDPGIVAFLTGAKGLDARFARFARLIECSDPGVPVNPGLLKIARNALDSNVAARICFSGEDDEAKRVAAATLAHATGRPLLLAHIGRAARSHAASANTTIEDWLDDFGREASLRRVIVYLDRFDGADEALREAAMAALESFRGITILSTTRDLCISGVRLKGILTIPFSVPVWPERRLAWKAALRRRGVNPRGPVLDNLAECFRFNASQIEDAAQTALNLARYRSEPPRAEHVFEAARTRSGHELATLTRRIVPVHRWSDMVLPQDSMHQLREVCRRVERRHQVLHKWGFERKLSGGKGVNALFHGYSGSGKTMAAEVIASELHQDLYKIDLAGVVSKYIGETEKNLDRIFAAAEDANAILLFDEADALFGKRSEVRDAHDRYANLEVSYLLEKMEQHEGVSILSTNLRQNLDDAFLRRLTFTIQFPFPDEASRRRIWQGIWPAETPLAPDVDAAWLASRFLLSGGNIRNVALAAAYLAVEEGNIVTLSHVVQAVRAEFHKMGRTLTPAELALPITTVSGAAA